MSGSALYAAVKSGGIKLGDLGDHELALMLGHLARKGKITGQAGRIWGEAMAEATLRFMKANTETTAKDDA